MAAMTVWKIAAALEAELLTKTADTRRSVNTAYASDLMSDVLAFGSANSILLTSLASAQAVRTAEVADIIAICFVLGKRPDEKAIELAEESNIPLMTTQTSLFSASGILHEMGLSGGVKAR